MTDTTFDTTAHPRSASSGRFVDAPKSAPETSLGPVPATFRDDDVKAAIDATTHGREQLERRISVPGGWGFDYSALIAARQNVWENAGGPEVPVLKLEPHLITQYTDITADNVERILEVTHYRAQSGQYTRASDWGDLTLTPVDPDELRGADYQAEARGDYVTEEWEAGRQVGPEAEVTEHSAKLFAEDALQNLPARCLLIDFPRLAEFATRPYSGAAGASHEKVDALRAEIHTLREAHEYLSPRQRARLDHLATYAMNALPGRD